MKNKLLSTHKIFWKIAIMMIFILPIFIVTDMSLTKAETPVTSIQEASDLTKSDGPSKININLTDVFQLDMFSITEKGSDGKAKIKFASVSGDLSALQNGTMTGIVCIGTYNDKKIITIISPLRGGEFKVKRPLSGIGTIYEITSSDMVNDIKTELERKKMLEEVSSDLDTKHYIVIDDEAILKETEKRVNNDLEKMKTTSSGSFRWIRTFSSIVGVIIIGVFIRWRKSKH